jgi:membrane AbrB-like protein
MGVSQETFRLMTPSPSRWPRAFRSATPRDLLHTCETLLIGTAGGLLFRWMELPGGLISGAMIAVGAAAIGGRPMGLPPLASHVILMTLGLSLGSMVSPRMLTNMAAYPVSIAILAISTFVVTFACSAYLRRIHRWDRISALLAASPGALSQIIMLANERKADVAGIAVVQTIRVIILTAALPLILAAAGLAQHGGASAMASPATPLALLVLVTACVATALALRLLRFPASWMFGAMLGSSVLHGTGLIEGGLPVWAYAAALIGIGALIGTRFARISARTLMSHMAAALGSFAVAIAVSAIFVALVAMVTHARFGDIVVAFAPGAMDAMLALALTLHIDPIFVSAHHLSRFMFVSVATPGIVHLFGRPQVDAYD